MKAHSNTTEMSSYERMMSNRKELLDAECFEGRYTSEGILHGSLNNASSSGLVSKMSPGCTSIEKKIQPALQFCQTHFFRGIGLLLNLTALL